MPLGTPKSGPRYERTDWETNPVIAILQSVQKASWLSQWIWVIPPVLTDSALMDGFYEKVVSIFPDTERWDRFIQFLIDKQADIILSFPSTKPVSREELKDKFLQEIFRYYNTIITVENDIISDKELDTLIDLYFGWVEK